MPNFVFTPPSAVTPFLQYMLANARGTDGATWYTGAGAPSDSLGVDNDLYLDTTLANVYKKTAGHYSIVTTIVPAPAFAIAPPVTSARGLLSMGAGPFDGTTSGFFAGSAAGTHIAINAASGFVGNMVDVQVAGVSQFSVSTVGATAPFGSGARCERFGAGAGNNACTGADNTLVGNNAGAAFTSGNGHTVVGSGAMTSALGTVTNCTAVGVGALAVCQTSECTAVGYRALAAVTTNGFQATAFGNLALASLTTGQLSCAFGSRALTNCTTGTNNSAFGKGAGQSVTTGSSNALFVSAQGAFALTTGNGNTIVGGSSSSNHNTGIVVATGNYNTLLGSGADTASSTTSQGIAIGNNATCSDNELIFSPNVTIVTLTGKNVTITPSSASNIGLIVQGRSAQSANVLEVRPTGTTTPTFAVSVTTGASAPFGGVDSFFGVPTSERFGSGAGNLTATNSGHTAFGFHALASVTSGDSNTAVGSQAGTSITTGGKNVALGQFTLISATTGSGNVALGTGAGLGLTTGSSNILIGGDGSSFTTTAGAATTNGIAIGLAAVCGTDGIALGRAVTAGANEFIISSQVTTMTLTGKNVTITPASASGIGLVVQGKSAQSANLLEIRPTGTSTPVTYLRDTVTGTSATSNFLNVTATLPSVLSTFGMGVRFDITSSSSAANGSYGLVTYLQAGATGNTESVAGYFQNNVACTATTWQTGQSNIGVAAYAVATTVGTNIGVNGTASGGNINMGGWFAANTSKNNATNIGVLSFGFNNGTSPVQIGGYFGLHAAGAVPTFTSAALVCDNGSTTSNIFTARDNGTAVFTIADGGGVTMTGLTITAGSVAIADATNLALGTTTGTSVGTATGQKLSFWGATPVVQQVLATGTGKTVDNVITLLQTLGLCKQS